MAIRENEDLGAYVDRMIEAQAAKAAPGPTPRAKSVAFEDQPCRICTAPRRICCC
jgi:hypothetical protein